MARKTSLKTEPNGLLSLMDLAVDQLDAAIHRPSILSYKPYPAQLDFHKCELTGRYMSAGNRAGKTTAAVVDAIYTAMNTHPYRKRPKGWPTKGLKLRFVCVDIDKGVRGMVLPEFKRWMSTSMLSCVRPVNAGCRTPSDNATTALSVPDTANGAALARNLSAADGSTPASASICGDGGSTGCWLCDAGFGAQ